MLTSSSAADNRIYSWMPCGTITSLPSAACAGSKGCQQEGLTYLPVGDPTGAVRKHHFISSITFFAEFFDYAELDKIVKLKNK